VQAQQWGCAMLIFLDILLVIGAIVLVLGTVASASRSRRQRKSDVWPTQGIWIHPQLRARHLQLQESPDDGVNAARYVRSAAMQ
jgi:hypothetical protein